MENINTTGTEAVAAERSLRSDMRGTYRRRLVAINLAHYTMVMLLLGVIVWTLLSALIVPPSFSQSTDVQQGNAMLRIKQIVDIA